MKSDSLPVIPTFKYIWCFLCIMKSSTHFGDSGEQINKKLSYLATICEARTLKARQQAQNGIAHAKSQITNQT